MTPTAVVCPAVDELKSVSGELAAVRQATEDDREGGGC